MKLLFPLGLLLTLAIVGPLVAHLLRRRKPEERAFPPARWVPTAPPVARRRAHLEDRALFSLRAVAIALLAMIAASPLVRCHRLSIDRRAGASVALAIVLDDSLSMSATLPSAERRVGVRSRFDLALSSARELQSGLRSGDSAMVVLAGSPARIVLAPSIEAASVGVALDQIEREYKDFASDRATDLEGAVAIAASALAQAPQLDRKIVVLSDLADGTRRTTALAAPSEFRGELSAPVAALRAAPDEGLADCALISASLDARDDVDGVRARVACTGVRATPLPRLDVLTVDTQHRRVGTAPLPPTAPIDGTPFDVAIALEPSEKGQPHVPVDGHPRLVARLIHASGGHDALPRNDEAPVLGTPTAPTIAIVAGDANAIDDVVATGGNVLERAIKALDTGVALRPLPAVPDRDVDLTGLAALILEDPAGLFSESRTAISRWLDGGGVALITLGPRAGAPPLGASFDPLLAHSVRWERVHGVLGIALDAQGPFATGDTPSIDLAATGRARFDAQDLPQLALGANYSDGAPLLRVVQRGLGEAWLVTLPFSPATSDLALRPAFLALLDRFVERARDREAALRIEPGGAWAVRPGESIAVVAIDGDGRPLADREVRVERIERAERDGAAAVVRPQSIGAYRVTTTDAAGTARVETRAVSAAARESDLSARPIAEATGAASVGDASRPALDMTPWLAWIVLGLALAEVATRVRRLFARPPADAPAA